MLDFHGEGVLGSIIRSTALKSIIGMSLLVAWKLFSKLLWSHELQTGEKTISTSLTTIAAPAYALPAAALPKNWATATAGAKYAITDKLSGYVSASLRGGGGGSGGFGASVGLNLAF